MTPRAPLPAFLPAPLARRRDAGFTLLELLVALTLSALLMTVVAAAIHQVGRDWRSTQGRLDDRLDIALALLQVERALQGAYPHLYMDPEDKDRKPLIYFDGQSKTLSWVSTVTPGGGPGMTAWRLENREEPLKGSAGRDGGGEEGAWSDWEESAAAGVVLRLAPAFVEDPGARLEEARERLLVPGYRARFSYLDQDQRDPEDQEWVERWPGEDYLVLPMGVRILFEPLESGREPLEVVAAIAAHRHSTVQPKAVRE